MITNHVRLYKEINRVLPDTERKKTIACRLLPGPKWMTSLASLLGQRVYDFLCPSQASEDALARVSKQEKDNLMALH